MILDLATQAYNALRHNRRRSVLTMLGMAWGIATVVLLLAYGTGFERGLWAAFRSFGTNLVFIFPGRTELQAGGTKAGTQVRLTVNDLDYIRAEVPLLKRVSPEAFKNCVVAYGTRSSNYGVSGVYAGYGRMRSSLLKTQRDLLESEQLATIGRMASSISHDLRHSLAAIVANSEFLCDSHLTPVQREELYQEVRSGVNLMTDLIDSLLEFARTRESLSPAYGNVAESINRTVQAVRLHPRHHNRSIDVLCSGQVSGWFDARKLERALYNLLLNACEAAPAAGGYVEVTAGEMGGSITISVADNGPGIAESIRERLFHPFVSFGKENGTGLGLAVVHKIVQDHNGEIFVERTPQGRTVFRIMLPGRLQDASRSANELHLDEASFVPAQPDDASQKSISHRGP